MFADPATLLAQGPIVIGPCKMYFLAFVLALLAVVYGLPTALLLAAGGPLQSHELLHVLALPVVLLTGAGIVMLRALLKLGAKMVLRAEGVELNYRRSVVWCPWEVFNAPGGAFVKRRTASTQMVLPIQVDAIPLIELRKSGTCVARGKDVKTRHFRVTPNAEIAFRALFEVIPRELGDLLLQLGRGLAVRLPPVPEPVRNEFIGTLSQAVPAVAGKRRWLTVSLTRLAWPPVCCNCGTPTSNWGELRAGPAGGWLLHPLVHYYHPPELRVRFPLCSVCFARWRRRQLLGRLCGAAFGILSVLGVALAMGIRPGDPEWGLSVFAGIVGLFVGPKLTGQEPVQIKWYSPGRNTVRVRFRRAFYAKLFLAGLNAPGLEEHFGSGTATAD